MPQSPEANNDDEPSVFGSTPTPEQRVLQRVHSPKQLANGDNVELVEYVGEPEGGKQLVRIGAVVFMLNKRLPAVRPQVYAVAETGPDARFPDDSGSMLLVMVGTDLHGKPVPVLTQCRYADFGLDPTVDYAENELYKVLPPADQPATGPSGLPAPGQA